MELNSLRETIQLTKTKYVSIFEFDIFTRYRISAKNKLLINTVMAIKGKVNLKFFYKKIF